MKMNKLALIVAVIALITGTQSCIDPIHNGMCISGLGDIVSEEVTLDSFTSVLDETVVDVEIIQGAEQKVVVEGNENMIGELKLIVSHGKLRIDLRSNCYNNFDLKVYITVPVLESVEVESTGDITLGDFKNLKELDLTTSSTGDIEGKGLIEVSGLTSLSTESTGSIKMDLTTNELRASIGSTGDIELSGSCIKQDIELDGTGNYRAFEFDSQECDIYSDGVGDARVYVSEKLDVTINSVGDVYVKGDPKVHSNDNSVGDLIYVH